MTAHINQNQTTASTVLISPITWYSSPYACEFPELNGVYFPLINPTADIEGVYFPADGSGQRFYPDIWYYRDFIAELIRRGVIIPSSALIARLQFQSHEIQLINGMFTARPIPEILVMPFGEYEARPSFDEIKETETAQRHILEFVTPLPKGYFKSQPDAIDLKMIFVEMYHVRLVDQEIFIFCHNHYKPAADSTVLKMIRGTFRDVIENPPDGGKRSSAICKKVLDEIKMDHSLEILDSDISYTMVAFRNYYFDTATMQFTPITPGYVPDKVVFYAIEANIREDIMNFTYDSRAWYTSTPIFDKYLCDVTGGNSTLIRRIYECIGYIITQDTYRKCMFVFQGVPDSGKSTLERLIKSMFVHGAVKALKGNALSERFSLKSLFRKALCSCSDLPDMPFSPQTESILKQLTGFDEIDTDVKFSDRISFYYTGKVVMFTNNPITVKSKYPEAFFNRVKVIPFAHKVQPTMTDKEFDALLAGELDAVVTKALVTYIVSHGQPGFFGDDEFKINEIYRRDCWNDPLAALIFDYAKECFEPSRGGRVIMDEAYRDFLRRTGLTATELYLNVFSHYFMEAAYDLYRAVHHRAAAEPNGNPVSCMKGMVFKV